MEKNNWLKTKRVTGLFAIIAFIGGFFFLNQGITGNVISGKTSSLFNPVLLIGTLMIFCAIVLSFYTARRK